MYLLVWSVYEQVMIAALDLGDDELIHKNMQKLKQKFPKSQRVERLQGSIVKSNKINT